MFLSTKNGTLWVEAEGGERVKGAAEVLVLGVGLGVAGFLLAAAFIRWLT